jgi:hypothetical protein
MAYLGVLLIAAANCFVVYVLSILAVGGDGTGDGIARVRLFGFAWVAVLSLVSLVLCARKKGGIAVLTAAGTLPTAYIAGVAFTIVGSVYESRKANTPEFEAACKNAGATFIATPAAPVHSIAYDWEGKYPPQLNYFTVGSNGNLTDLRGGVGLSPYPSAITFTEGRCCQYEGRPLNGIGPYIRRPNGGEYFGVTELTADALVMYRSSPIGLQTAESNLTQFHVDVVDRRDGRPLASLRYLLDTRKQRGCGTTTQGVMNERAFVLQAIGVR